MGRKEDNIAKAMKLIENPVRIRNMGIAAHIDHGKTTLSDNLIAGAGMMRPTGFLLPQLPVQAGWHRRCRL